MLGRRQKKTEKTMSGRQRIVYVIDDDEAVRTAMARLLQSANLDVETFTSLDQFLMTPKQTEASCILVDVGTSGMEAEELRQRMALVGTEIPLVVVSASDRSSSLDRAQQIGAVSFFQKPIDDQALLDAIVWAIAKSRSPRSAP
jgi:FixJ family two-component response regulator